MKVFKDTTGREWTVAVNVSAVKRVRDLLGIDLMDALGGSLVSKLISDHVLLVNIVYAVCKPQTDAAGITDEEFGERMAGDAIDDATDALLDELVSFSPNPRDRAALGKVLEKTREVMNKARDLTEERIKGGELERAGEEVIAQMRGKRGPSSGAAPGASASTPASSPCANSSTWRKAKSAKSGAGSPTSSRTSRTSTATRKSQPPTTPATGTPSRGDKPTKSFKRRSPS